MRRNADMGERLRRAVWAAATITLVAVACGGCAYVVPTTSLDREKEAKWVASDVPVPEGFVIDQKQSKIHERTNRSMLLFYKRKDYIDMERAVDFYKESCAAHGWTLGFMCGFERRCLIFDKGGEELRVTIERSLMDAYVTSTIELEPREQPSPLPEVARKD